MSLIRKENYYLGLLSLVLISVITLVAGYIVVLPIGKKFAPIVVYETTIPYGYYYDKERYVNTETGIVTWIKSDGSRFALATDVKALFLPWKWKKVELIGNYVALSHQESSDQDSHEWKGVPHQDINNQLKPGTKISIRYQKINDVSAYQHSWPFTQSPEEDMWILVYDY